jgi:hypothetical protein
VVSGSRKSPPFLGKCDVSGILLYGNPERFWRKKNGKKKRIFGARGRMGKMGFSIGYEYCGKCGDADMGG